MKALQYIEIDLDHCSLTYGVLPCQATLVGSPPTGTKKCFNTPATCQDRANFTNVPVTMRFAVPTDYLPATIDAIPNVKQISFSPGAVSLGQNLGQRSALTITFEDHRHSDTGVGGDKYLADRAYNPYTQGTFLAKFRARNKFLSNRPLRWINGEVGQALIDMETRHYVIDSYSGPNNNGEYTITAKDVLRLADDNKALAPTTSPCSLAADITNVATSATLTPATSVVDYPNSGYVSIGGSEIVKYTHQLGYEGDSPAGAAPFAVLDQSRGMSQVAAITGAVDGKQITLSFWLKPRATLTGSRIFNIGTGTFVAGNWRIDFFWDGTTGKLHLMARDPTPTTILDATISNDPPEQLVWSHIILAIDLANTANRYVYVNDVLQTVTWSTYTNANIDWTGSGYHLFADHGGVNPLTNGDIAEMWIEDAFIDISVEANRRKFVTATRRPVFLGSTGQVPTGSTPLFYFNSSGNAWPTNLGTGGGAGLTGGGLPAATFNDGANIQLLARGQLGTTASSHSTDDRVQSILTYTNQDPANIIRDLLVTYAGIDDSFVPITDWLAETQTYLGRLFSATIGVPTGVNTLVSELIEQAGLIFWWDDLDQNIGLAVIRGAIPGSQEFNADNTLAGSLTITDQPDKRLSQITTYFGQINPLTSLTDKNNFRSVEVTTDAQAEIDYGSVELKEIFSRWIPVTGRASAKAINDLLLSRFRDPPRHFKFQQLRGATDIPNLARTYLLGGWPLQTDEGASDLVQVQITRVKPLADIIEIEGDELLFTGADTNTRNITFDVSTNDVNARTAHDALYTPPVTGNVINFFINSGVVIGCTSATGRAFDIGTWPAGVTITLTVMGRIQGKGGNGGAYFGDPNGVAGSIALYTRQAITLTDATGQIWGGGGGGGAGIAGSNDVGGGGGAGTLAGTGGGSPSGFPGSPGTDTAGGAAGFPAGGAAGGGPGLAGGAGNIGSAGAAGAAIDGVSFVTTSGSAGDRRGGQIN